MQDLYDENINKTLLIKKLTPIKFKKNDSKRKNRI